MTFHDAPSPHSLHFISDEDQLLDELVLDNWIYESPGRGRALARAALARWVAEGLPVRTFRGVRMFDPFAVHNFMKIAGLERGDPVFEGDHVRTKRRMVLEASPARSHDASGFHSPGGFEVVLRRDFDLTGLTPGRTVRLRLPLPLEGPSLTGLTVEVTSPSADPAAITVEAGRLTVPVEVPSDTSDLYAIEARLSFTAFQERWVIDPERLSLPDSAAERDTGCTRAPKGRASIPGCPPFSSETRLGPPKGSLNPKRADNFFSPPLGGPGP